MADATGETKEPLRVTFDRRLELEFHGARITSDAGLLAYRELDDALSLTTMANSALAEGRRRKNIRHRLLGLLRTPSACRPTRSCRSGSGTCSRGKSAAGRRSRTSSSRASPTRRRAGPAGQAGAALDAAVLPRLPGQRGPPGAVRARLQPGQLPAQPGAAGRGGAVVAEHAAREAGQDRRPDRAPRPLPRIPAGRGGGAASIVRRHPAPDRPPARTARCIGLTGANHGAARAEGRAMRRDRPAPQARTESACRPGDGGPLHLVSAVRRASRLTGSRPKSSFSGASRAHLDNVG